jgi:hypothetical protein
MERKEIIEAIEAELERAYTKHGCEQWGRHEFYAIMKEEVDEVWDAIKSDMHQPAVEKEAIQVAAMCVRYLETGDRYRSPNKQLQRTGNAATVSRLNAQNKKKRVRRIARTDSSRGYREI